MANFTPAEIEEILQAFFDVAGKRQYVGARYVPTFGRKGENSINWDNSAPYEPLTIVLYQGNSYTSRTYVPADVAITDTHYWALTGNYNAQVEAYRSETQGAIADIATINNALPIAAFGTTTVKDYIDDLTLGEANVLRHGAKRGNVQNDWTQIFADCIAAAGGVYFPDGLWYIKGEYTAEECNYFVGSGAILRFDNINSRLNIASTFESRFLTITGFVFDGLFTAEDCLHITSSNSGLVANCAFRNFLGVCLTQEILGLNCMNCSFIDTDMYFLDANIDFRMTGIVCKTDNTITSCKFFGCKYGIRLSGSSTINDCYMFGNVKQSRINYGVWCLDDQDVIDGVVITGTEFDTITYCLCACSRVTIDGCIFMWDSDVHNIESAIFLATRALIVYDTTIVNSTFYTPRADHDFMVYTFRASQAQPLIHVGNYHSNDCHVRIRQSLTPTRNALFTVGIDNTSGDYPSSISRFYKEAYDNAFVPRITITSVLGNLQIRIGNDNGLVIGTPNAFTAPPSNMVAFDTLRGSSQTPIYYHGNNETINEIRINGPALNYDAINVYSDGMPTLEHNLTKRMLILEE